MLIQENMVWLVGGLVLACLGHLTFIDLIALVRSERWDVTGSERETEGNEIAFTATGTFSVPFNLIRNFGTHI